MKNDELIDYLNQVLSPNLFNDYAPNGLQVQGCSDVKKILTAVSASQDAINAAIESKADMLLVHHGYFWKGEADVIVGMKQRRLKALLSNNINLVAYHLPLDAHPVFGNNIQLAKRLELSNLATLEPDNPTCLVLTGELEQAITGQQFSEHISACLGQPPLHIAGHNRRIQRVGLCTGGGQDFIDQAASVGLDAFLSGEASERTYYSAKEQDIDYFGCGHHATERGGIRALGEHLSQQFALDVTFFDTPNPI